MADDLVLARSKRTQRVAPMSRFLAERSGAEILDESPFNDDRTIKRVTTKTGRPVKPRTTVATEAAAKSANKADDQAVTESATEKKEQGQ
jgi:hypothetical protein